MNPLIVCALVVAWFACGYLALRYRASWGPMDSEVAMGTFILGPLAFVLMLVCAIMAHAITTGQKDQDEESAPLFYQYEEGGR